MKLYDSIIAETMEKVSAKTYKKYSYDRNSAWKLLDNTEFIMQRDAALELGGMREPSVNYTCVTTDSDISEDEILVVGKDITEINGSISFARVIILKTSDLGEETDSEKAFGTIRNLDFVRYHVYPEGYMVRVSASSNLEQVRVSKDALKRGISFSRVGSSYISKYKELPEVKKVRVIFITDKELVESLVPNADKVDKITRTLTKILDGMPTDCGHCSMKAVCDEVDGLKELHLKKRN